ncbi:MAG: hypothetical protein HYY04_11915 [Chloroflexi bacterium]|nr:hypothetical protein [Chloroflexota bacterium]
MPDPMTSRDRLRTALCLGQPDRVPVTLYEIDPFLSVAWRAFDHTYDRVRQAARDLQDTISFARLDVGLFHSAPDSFPVERRTWAEGASTFVETIVPTPRGRPLRSLYRRHDGVETSWRLKLPVEDEDDLEAFLSLPYTPSLPDLAEVDRADGELGERGLITFSLGDPLGAVLGLLPFETFALWSTTERDRANIRRLLDVMHERVYRLVDHLVAHSHQRAFRFWGPEYAGPSLLPPARFKEFVVDYLTDIVRLVRRSGNYAIVHCHARLNAILELIARMEPNALEPIESIPASGGDVTLADVKRRIGDRVCLMGNIQGLDLETGTPDEVERLVAQAIAEGGPGGGFILMPTAMPVTPLDERMERNILRFMEAGRRYGRYP